MTDNASPAPFVLSHLEVFNWGPFQGRHCVEINPEGSAIIGPTGSGKTTLVDALMTLLVARPKYNLASTGGHESDRDLISYIRGVTGSGNNSDSSHISRQGKVTTGISAHFSNAAQQIQIGVIMWIDSTSSASKDQKDLWFLTERDDQSLEQWLTLHQEGGARTLKQYGRETSGLHIFDTRKSYLARLRQRFEVGENAFALLNRAAGLKQLNSIDEIFRDLVLEDRSAFLRAAEVCKEFDDLSTIRAELEIARKQEQSLTPIARTHEKYIAAGQELTTHEALLQILPIWFAMAGHRLWGQRASDLQQQLEQLDLDIRTKETQENTLKSHATSLKEAYLRVGGADIEQLDDMINGQEKQLESLRKNAADYQQLTAALELDPTLSVHALLDNQQQIEQRKTDLKSKLETQKQKQIEAAGELHSLRRHKARVKLDLEKSQQRPDSNIRSEHNDFRAELAHELGLDEDSLPFLAQLLEVKPEERQWQGAIERAIGTHRLRILVPPEKMGPALDWVNSRHNRLHVRLMEATKPSQPAAFKNDGFTRKLKFKEHPCREVVKFFLAGIDRHCVDSPATLRQTPYGMTMQGLMSGRTGFFDKHDQRPLDMDWMTGFDNRHRLESLARELQQLEVEGKRREDAHTAAERQVKSSESNLSLLDSLANLDFETIDCPGAEDKLEKSRQRRKYLVSPDSEAGKARQASQQAEEDLNTLSQEIRHLSGTRAVVDKDLTRATEHKNRAFNRIGSGLDDGQLQLGKEKLPKLEQDTDAEDLNEAERNIQSTLSDKRELVRRQHGKLGQDLVGLMGSAQKVDTGALSEVGTQIIDLPFYLDRLKTLREEALPAKLTRFLDYLNTSSDQGVNQLLTDMENEVSQIEERIEELNKTLLKVDFQPGQYLQLDPQRVVHEIITTMHKARSRLRSAALKDDQGESHYSALKNVVDILRDASERKNTVSAKALLDPRHRLQFAGSVRDRHSLKIISKFKGSQSGSGGEKEIIASYILTASLAYALCPEGMDRPLFGTIVLDEAFSKSSQAVAGRIVQALLEFGLHPLFITPNKEMRLLRNHTRSAVLVHRKGQRATLTTLSWEQLEEIAKRKIKSHEVH